MFNQEGNFLPVIGIIALIFLIGGGGYYIGTNKYMLLYKLQTIFPKKEIAALPTPTPVPCHAKQSTYRLLDDSQFDIKAKFIGNQNYPSEMTDLCDNQLVGMNCLEPYTLAADGSYKFTKTEMVGTAEVATMLQVTQEDILDNINRVKRKLDGKDPDKIRFCNIGNGDLIAEYEIWKDKTKSNNIAYFAQLYAQGGVQEIASISNPEVPNFTCDKPLLLTSENKLYVECYGGVAASPTYKAIHKISINQAADSKEPDLTIVQCFLSEDQTTVSCTEGAVAPY